MLEFLLFLYKDMSKLLLLATTVTTRVLTLFQECVTSRIRISPIINVKASVANTHGVWLTVTMTLTGAISLLPTKHHVQVIPPYKLELWQRQEVN